MKIFTKLAAVVFSFIAVLHVLRLIYGWEANIGSINLPVWISGLGALIAGVLAWGLCKELK